MPTNFAHVVLIVATAYGFGTMYDLVQRSRVQNRRAEESEIRLKMLVANAPLIFWYIDADGRFRAREGGRSGRSQRAEEDGV